MTKPDKTSVILRADGNSEIGLGHIIRCLALAEMLKEDFSCIFVTRFVTGYLRGEITAVCDELIELDKTDRHFDQFLQMLTGDELVIVDNYFFDTDYQRAIKEKGCKLVCLDDLHDRHFVADAIVNHAGGIDMEDYSTAPYTCLYSGISYAIVRPQFLTRKIPLPPTSSLFVCMGGADKDNATGRVLGLLEAKQFPHSCHIVIGDAFAHLQKLQDFKRSSQLDLNIHQNIPAQTMADIMSECTYAICPPSTVSYEYLSVRGGELYVNMTADNQKDIYAFFLENKLAFDLSELFVEDRRAIALSLKKQKECFDGKSKARFLSLFRSLQRERMLTLRKATISDMELYFQWVNDPESRRNALNPKAIAHEEHVHWFSRKVSDKDTYLYVVEENKAPVGHVRFDCNIPGEEAIISYFVDPLHRQKGLGLSILKLGIEQFTQENNVIKLLKGYVKKSNVASNRIFERLCFQTGEKEIVANPEFTLYKKPLLSGNKPVIES